MAEHQSQGEKRSARSKRTNGRRVHNLEATQVIACYLMTEVKCFASIITTDVLFTYFQKEYGQLE